MHTHAHARSSRKGPSGPPSSGKAFLTTPAHFSQIPRKSVSPPTAKHKQQHSVSTQRRQLGQWGLAVHPQPSEQAAPMRVSGTEQEPTFHALISGHVGGAPNPKPLPNSVTSASQSTMVEGSTPEQPGGPRVPIAGVHWGAQLSIVSAGPRGTTPTSARGCLPKKED